MTAVSQWEREAIGERTATALQHKKAHRQVYSATPFGFVRIGDELGRHPQEQAVISRIRLYRSSGWTLQRIADLLNGEGTPAKLGGKWHPKTVKGVLDNSLNATNAA